MTEILSGQDLINAGFEQGRWFREAILAANKVLAAGGTLDQAITRAKDFAPAPALSLRAVGELPFYMNIEASNDIERANVAAVKATMTEIMRTPVVVAGAIMPDACPAGPLGTIPVGGVVASKALHPGMHSADICCSLTLTTYPGVDPKTLLDAVHGITHFGPGGRPRGSQVKPSGDLLERMERNEFTRDLISPAIEHFMTQGDGNHFAYVGTLKSTGETTLVTHHGSRAPGARLYDKGMKVADKFRREISPETLRQNAWIPFETKEGEAYWEALQLIRQWTKENHAAIHDSAAESLAVRSGDRFWNEHNFVFMRDDLFYHAKGATPAFDGWAPDASAHTIIPLNMAEPILIARGRDAAHGLGFAPHGAGRNMSRTAHKRLQAGRTVEEIFAEETKGIDARFYCGVVDISELASGYKKSATVRQQIEDFGLADIVDEVTPFGCIMAGDVQANAPWRKKKQRRD